MINVVHFIMDDLRSELSGAYGRSHVSTPHMDALAARGLAFRRAYSQISLCGPSRTSFLTGRRPSATRYLGKRHSSFRSVPGAQQWLTLPEQFKRHDCMPACLLEPSAHRENHPVRRAPGQT